MRKFTKFDFKNKKSDCNRYIGDAQPVQPSFHHEPNVWSLNSGLVRLYYIGSDCSFTKSSVFRSKNHGSFGYDLKNKDSMIPYATGVGTKYSHC
jgi:hypothetical protein